MRETATFETGPDGSLVLAVGPGADAPFDYEDLTVDLGGTTIHVTAPGAGEITLEAVHGTAVD